MTRARACQEQRSRGSTPTSSTPWSTRADRCSSSPAPAPARPGCSPTASPTSSTRACSRRDPRHHVHQQGRRRDAPAGRCAGRAGRAHDVGVDVPLGVRAHPARQRRRARLPAPVLDLRPGRLHAAHRLRDPRPRPRLEALHRRVACTPSSAVEERARRPPHAAAAGVSTSSSASTPTSTPSTRTASSKAGAMDFDDLLVNTVRAVPRAPRRARAVPPALRAHPRRRVPGHEPGPERDRPAARRRPPATSPSSATRTSACRPGTLVAHAARRGADRVADRSATS